MKKTGIIIVRLSLRGRVTVYIYERPSSTFNYATMITETSENHILIVHNMFAYCIAENSSP